MNQKGFSQVILLGIVAVFILAGIGWFLVFQEKEASPLPLSSSSPLVALGNFCSDEKGCVDFCLNNRRRCEEYCKGNKDELCTKVSAAYNKPKEAVAPKKVTVSQPTKTPQIGSEDKPPVLKNLGIVLDIPNLQTNRAGDMLFDKIVIWEDENLYSDKAFGDFGEMGKRKNGPNYPGVEYNYAVPAGTKVYAAGDGIASVFYIEHTKDWGVNIQPKQGSRWNIGHEHLVNLAVKTGDAIKAGDILGEATPYWKGYAVTQLAVWTGGRDGIVKYCPFSFLEDNLEPAYGEKLKRIANDWEEFTGQDVYKQENWVAPGCLLDKIIESSGN